MRIHKNKNSIIISDKIPLAVSASNRKITDEKGNKINKRFYTYRATIPKIFLSSLIKNNKYCDDKKEFTLIPNENRDYYFTNQGNMTIDLHDIEMKRFSKFQTGQWYKILQKSKDSYKITLPKSSLIELYVIDKYMDSLEKVKDRTPIYLYFKLKMDLFENKTILTFHFNNKYASNEIVKLFKKRLFSENLDYTYIFAMLYAAQKVNNDIDGIYDYLKKDEDEINHDLNEELEKLDEYYNRPETKITTWKLNVETFKSEYDVELISLMVEKNDYYQKLWDVVLDKELSKINLDKLKIEIDEILCNNYDKYLPYPELYIQYKGLTFKTSFEELDRLDKDILGAVEDYDEFIALFLRQKSMYNRKKLIIAGERP
ncbi:MAG: hypothetical protein E7Z84_06650 [Methanosphaera stadtmanae]|nr:hypothetical protein [Methanosphaera stadtmanae]